MAFMVPAAKYLTGYIVDGPRGTEMVPADVAPRGVPGGFSSTHGKIWSVERVAGWFGRLSAPGYLDATEWDGPHATEDEAIAAVCEKYGVDEDGEDEDGEQTECRECGSEAFYATSFCNFAHCRECGCSWTEEHADCAVSPCMIADERAGRYQERHECRVPGEAEGTACHYSALEENGEELGRIIDAGPDAV